MFRISQTTVHTGTLCSDILDIPDFMVREIIHCELMTPPRPSCRYSNAA